ncbi:MAG: CopG family transcriptional regulator [Bryobacteraceae bacterium]|jgi:hypothetical protein
MRTTLELDDDLLASARQLAQEQGVTLGQFISALARQALATKSPQKVRNGFLLFETKPGAPRPDLRLVNELRDAEP